LRPHVKGARAAFDRLRPIDLYQEVSGTSGASSPGLAGVVVGTVVSAGLFRAKRRTWRSRRRPD
jgi:hypothetical protein